jgi:type II secretion system protein G
MNISQLFNSFSLPSLTRKSEKVKFGSSRAFTLVEILITITILGILASIILVSTNGTREAARDSRRQSDLSQIRKSLQAYYLATGVYPTTEASEGISLQEDSAANATFTQAMKGGGYMSIIPKDPSYTAGGDYDYKYIATTSDAYTLCAKSEYKGGYFCTDQDNGGISRTSTVAVFGSWGAGGSEGEEEAFACGDAVTFTYNGGSVTYNSTSTTGDKCWLDRNLGATQVATAYNDSNAYGDLFQWGRLDDGHQVRNSGTTATLSDSSNPGHSNFITASGSPYDWVSPQIDNLWQGVSGTNNPCPSGWRVPTETEWDAERASWSQQNYNGAFASPLKLTATGYRHRGAAIVLDADSGGYYWSSAVSSANARYLYLDGGSTFVNGNYRAYGYSIRCVRD